MFDDEKLKEGRVYLQRGIVRSNCVDGLDRTNVSQLTMGMYVLGYQLYSIGVMKEPHMLNYPELIKVLIDLYQHLGDKIALQYGGSQTVSSGINYRGVSWDVFTSVKRYYSNNFIDAVRQNQMNLLLGVYDCEKISKNFGKLKDIWDLKWDYYIHEISGKTPIEPPKEPLEVKKEENESEIVITIEEKKKKDVEERVEEEVVVVEVKKDALEERTSDLFDNYYNEYNLVDLSQRVNTIMKESIILKHSDISNLNTPHHSQHLHTPLTPPKHTHITPQKQLHFLDTQKKDFPLPKTRRRDKKIFETYVNSFSDNEKIEKFSKNSKKKFYEIYSKKKYGIIVQKNVKDDKMYKRYSSSFQQWKSMFVAVLPKRWKTMKEMQVIVHREMINRLAKFFPLVGKEFCSKFLIKKFSAVVLKVKNKIKCEEHLIFTEIKKKKQLYVNLAKGGFYMNCFYGNELLNLLWNNEEIRKGIYFKKKESVFEFINLLVDNHIVHEVAHNHYAPFNFKNKEFHLFKFQLQKKVLNSKIQVLDEQSIKKMGDIVKYSISTLQLLMEVRNTKKNSKYSLFLKKIACLKRVNLRELKEGDSLKRISFFVNIFNMLYYHGIEEIGGEHKKGNEILFQKSFSYDIGGVVLSLYDIKYGILFPYLRNPIVLLEEEEESGREFALSSSEWDWRLWFILIDEKFISSPFYVNKDNIKYILKKKSSSLVKYDNQKKIVIVPSRLKGTVIVKYLSSLYSDFKFSYIDLTSN